MKKTLMMFKLKCLISTLCTAKLCLVLIVNSVAQATSPAVISEVCFKTEDGITVYGDYIKVDPQRPIIILLHQGRSNGRGEYGPIIPKLTSQNFNLLVIDQRLGGDLYGFDNRTVNANTSKDHEYCSAIADLKAAYNYAVDQGFKNKIILWGSSYSASLAVKLASQKQDEVLGVLAFSPSSGGPMKDCKADSFFKDLKVPLLVLRPSKELEIPSVKAQLDSAQFYLHKTYVALQGTHGSSMLVEERVGEAVEENWKVVFSFLKEIVEGR